MKVGITSHYTEGFDTILEDFRVKRPTIILAVPRVCEKIYARIMTQVREQPPWKRRIFRWASGIGAEVSALRERKRPVSTLLNLRYRVADLLIYRKLREGLGGRVRWITAAGAPLSREIEDFFNASGIFVIEGYGLTETTAPVSLNVTDDYRFGTTGKPLPCNEVRIADDGEILVRGGNIFRGYWRMPRQTEEDGFLIITDRKKDMIITSGGKNIAPQNVEGMFMKDPLFEHVVAIGDRRKYLTALISLNMVEAERIAREAGLSFAATEELLDRDGFLAIVAERVADRNRLLARVETIKDYRLLRQPLSEKTGELTPSLKLKRKVVLEKYRELIEGMYPPEIL
jgi:long-chain acyl-CoA synthetase